MTEVSKKILTRGYVRTEIRPTHFVQDRISFDRLESVLTDSKVSIAGWDFPHLGRSADLLHGKDWIGSNAEWEHRLESFRFYQSGLLVDLRGFGWDWRDESGFWPAKETSDWAQGTALSVVDTIHRFLETYLFAGRLAATDAGEDVMHVKMLWGNLKGRELIGDQRRIFWYGPHRTDMPTWPIDDDCQRFDLANREREIALEKSAELFKRFGWETSPEVLGELLRP